MIVRMIVGMTHMVHYILKMTIKIREKNVDVYVQINGPSFSNKYISLGENISNKRHSEEKYSLIDDSNVKGKNELEVVKNYALNEKIIDDIDPTKYQFEKSSIIYN